MPGGGGFSAGEPGSPFPYDVYIGNAGFMCLRLDASGSPVDQDGTIQWHEEKMPFVPGTPTPESAPYVVDADFEQPEGFYSFSDGMGTREQEYKRDRDTDGYYHGHYIDSVGDYLINGPLVNQVTPVTVDATNGIKGFLEPTIGGTRHIAALNGRYLLLNTDDTSTGWNTQSKDFGAGTTATRSAIFRGTGSTVPIAFIAMGTATNFWTWDMASNTTAFTQATGTFTSAAIAFKTYHEEMWMLNVDSHGAYRVQKCLDGTVAPTWSGAFTVADATNQCTDLAIVNDRLYVVSQQGLLGVAAAENDALELTGDQFKFQYHAANNVQPTAFSNYLITPLGRSLFRYEASGDMTEMGLGVLRRNDSPVTGVPTAVCAYQNWFVYAAFYNANTSTAYIMKWGTWKFIKTTFNPIPERVFVPSWQGALWEQSAQINAMWVSEASGQPRLYFGDANGVISWFALPGNGPDPTGDTNCRYNTSNPFQLYCAGITHGNPGLNKVDLGVEITGQNLNVAVTYRTAPTGSYGGATNLTNAGVFNMDPGQRNDFNPAPMSQWLDILATGTAASTVTPCILKSLVTYQALRPAYKRVCTAKLRLGSRVVTRTAQPIVDWTMKDMKTYLESQMSTGPLQLTTPSGQTFNVLMTDLKMDVLTPPESKRDIELVATVQLMEQLTVNTAGQHARLQGYTHSALSNYTHGALANL